MKRLALAAFMLFALVLLLPACQNVEKSYDSVSAQIEGDQYYNDGKYQQAIDMYNKAINIDGDGVLHYKLAMAYEKMGDKKLALENLKKAEEIAKFLHQKVTAKISELDPEASIEILDKATNVIDEEKKEAQDTINKEQSESSEGEMTSNEQETQESNEPETKKPVVDEQPKG